MAFKIKIEPEARLDIQEAIFWYNKQQKGLGKKFHKAVLTHFDSLTKNPHFEIRYDNVLCLPLKKFPYMVHFTVDEVQQIVTVRAVFHTALNPKEWKGRK
jgi:plasmid stabilization system protein ParE